MEKEKTSPAEVGAEAKPFTKETLKQLLERAGLELSDQELETLTPRVSQFLQGITSPEELDLGDLEPVVSFDRVGG